MGNFAVGQEARRLLDKHLRATRWSRLAVSPDGTAVVGELMVPDDASGRYVSNLFELSRDGGLRQLTFSSAGASQPIFAYDGTLLFLSVDGGRDDGSLSRAALWRLPSDSMRAELVAQHPGGITSFAAAGCAPVVVVRALVMSGAQSIEEDADVRAARQRNGRSGILHSGLRVSQMDKDLGPDEPRLYVLRLDDPLLDLDDLTGDVGRSLRNQPFAVSPDGQSVATTWLVEEPGLTLRQELWHIDVESGSARRLAGDAQHDLHDAAFSSDSRAVVAAVSRRSSRTAPPRFRLLVQATDADAPRFLSSPLEVRPIRPQLAPNGSAILFAADERGHTPIHRLDLKSEEILPVTTNGAYQVEQVCVDGIYALRSSIRNPPEPVRIPLPTTELGQITNLAHRQPPVLTTPSVAPRRVSATADDGALVEGWLLLPEVHPGHPPPAFIVWLHGGPLMSWSRWLWGWNPWILAASGYAVLMVDPALSTGYGQAFIERGWGRWAREPVTDTLSLIDQTVGQHRIDTNRIAVMGASFGGFLSLALAERDSRFRAVVVQSAPYALDSFVATSDSGHYFSREFGRGPDSVAIRDNSPHFSVENLTTPVLVTHGRFDNRVPLAEALRLWSDLHLTAPRVGHRFLYFPNEGHSIGRLGNLELWYETVLEFLSNHLELKSANGSSMGPSNGVGVCGERRVREVEELSAPETAA